jgi:peptidyl-prolyl cis-trans isomerase A (cyclophilin A)
MGDEATTTGQAQRWQVVEIATDIGRIAIALYLHKAPLSAGAFLRLVDDGSFTRSGVFHRTVRSNDNDHGHPPIDVIQGGLLEPLNGLPAVEHETTQRTAIQHLDGTVSLARGPVGTATGASFFICIGDQPALDAGGGRDPFGDDQGFAAFGRVIYGMDVVRTIHQLPARGPSCNPYSRGQMLEPPIRITRAACRSRLLDSDIACDPATEDA